MCSGGDSWPLTIALPIYRIPNTHFDNKSLDTDSQMRFTMLNILTEPVIRFDWTGGFSSDVSLPEVYAELMGDSVVAFPALRPHQRHAWHAFLVQLGAMAMHRADVGTPPTTAAEWLTLLRGLTADFPGDEPWQLVVDDITKPAFMQPPARSAEREKDYKGIVNTPDELDILVTSKNHDLKSSLAAQARVDDWIFALVTLQTMEGYGGAGNFGVSRMNSGFGSRPAFTLSPSGRPGAHVKSDIITLREQGDSIFHQYPMRPGGIGLLWTVPWDGARSEELTPPDLDPLYIEVCRRVRLRCHAADNRLIGLRTSSKAARIESKALNGQTGDPWTPINIKENKSLTLAAGGFTYNRVVDYLTSADWRQPILFQPTPTEHETQLVARAMVRGQGKTEGYYERIIPLRQRAAQAFGRAGGAQELGDLARERIEQIAKVKGILRLGIATFAAGGRAERPSDEHRSRARPWADKLDEIVDANFFDALQSELEVELDERQVIRNKWLLNGKNGVVDHARRILHTATESIPVPSIQRFRAQVRAESVFEGSLHGSNGLPFLFQRLDQEDE